MNINQSTGFNTYSQYSSYTYKYQAESRVTRTEGGIQVGKAENNKGPQLSDAAKQYLDSLRQKYTNIDFTVADFTTQEEADDIMRRSGGTKEYSAVIDPETLEKMATNEETRKKYESILDKTGATFESIRSEFNEDELKDIRSLGLSIDKDGNVNYIVRMRQGNIDLMESNRKAGEERRAEERDKAEKAERTNGSGRRAGHMKPDDEITITASSVEELVEKIRAQLAENNRAFLKTEEEKSVGQTIDFKA